MKSKLITIIGLLTLASIILFFPPMGTTPTELIIIIIINIICGIIGAITGIHLRRWYDESK